MEIGLAYQALERVRCPKPVDKFDFVAKACERRTVLDLGALDENQWQLKSAGSKWLHGRISESAREVLGVDNSESIPPGGLPTGPQSVIVRGNIYELEAVPMKIQPDVVVAGELLEHLPNATEFLCKLQEDDRLKGAHLVLTTPNACSIHNAMLGVFSRESMDPGHLAIYSYKTLVTLLRGAGIKVDSITPYHASFPDLMLRSRGLARVGVRGFEWLVNRLERFFPLLSSGWIVTAQL